MKWSLNNFIGKPSVKTSLKQKKINTDSTVNISGNVVNKVSLNKKNTKNIKNVTNLMVDIVKRQRLLWRKELNDLELARRARYNTEIPQNYLLQELYLDILQDGHLTGITSNRTLRTTNKKYIFSINGKKNEKLTEYIKDKQWFEYTIEKAHESTYFGGGLLWVKKFKKGEIEEVELVDRGQVIPEKNILLYDIYSSKGIDFTDVPEVLWYSQFYDVIGILEKAATYTILKRHSWGSWDEFEELFGIPIRIAKIASQSEQVKNEVAGWLEEMGSAPYGVFPIGTEVEIKENSKNDSFQVFFKKIEALDRELSKLVLHQTMTTEDGGSRAQGAIHENTLEHVVFADEKKMLAFLNDTVVPAMRALGYSIPENAKIQIEKTTDPQKQIEVDREFISGGYILEKDYIQETYGTKIKYTPDQVNQNNKGKD